MSAAPRRGRPARESVRSAVAGPARESLRRAAVASLGGSAGPSARRPERGAGRPAAPSRLLLVAGLFAALLAGCAERPEPPRPGAPAPGFELADLEGNRHRLSDFAGQVVVLNFWATWCPPCVEEMPSLQQLADRLGPEGLAVVAVSVDERYADIEPFVERHGLRFLVLHDLGKRVSRRYEVHQFPETWIVDRDGRLASHLVGARDWSAPESLEVFRSLLARPSDTDS